MTPTPSSAPAPQFPPLRPGLRGYAVSLLTAIYVLNFLDRQVVTILAEPIKRELGLSDGQLGAMTGLAFALLYTVLGLPIARIAERAHRPRLIALSVAVWSLFTVLCGFANNFTQLVLARIGVGVGEAGATPTSLALISDYVPRERRASMISRFMCGAPLGALIGMAVGGIVAQHYGWRMAFIVVGAPGLVLSLIAALTLPEPRRQTAAERAASPPRQPVESFGVVLKVLARNRTYQLVVLAMMLQAILQYGMNGFMGSFFFRNHAAELASVSASLGMAPIGFLGVALGVTLGVTGVVGAFAAGAIADRLAVKDTRAYVVLPAIAALTTVPFAVASLLSPSLLGALALMIVPFTCHALAYGPAYGVVQGLVPPTMRATAVAIMLFVLNLVGLGLGPLVIGMASDAFSVTMGEAHGLRLALILSGLLGVPIAACFWFARNSLIRDTVS